MGKVEIFDFPARFRRRDLARRAQASPGR